MCGLAGYIKTTASEFMHNPQLLEALHKSIEHRGPDAHNVWSSPLHEAALVHRRLSILDLSDAGIQPMFDKDQTVVICFNGEIYNYQALRAELQALGHQFFSQTDTEVFLYAFKEWGIACLDRLEGMFAAALGNLKTHDWYLVRDRMGIKPLYFSLEGGYLSFGSEIKALTTLPWIKCKRNDRALYHYLTFMVTPAPLTLYADIYKLPAGHYMHLDTHKNYSFHEWYTPLKPRIIYDKKDLNNEEFCIQKIRELLRNAVKKRMMSDVPFGAFLSGGIDSSLAVALMSEFTDRVKTFNISFSDGPEYSETAWARKISQQFNTEHHEMVISEKEAFDFFERMVTYQDEPIADCVCIPLYHVAKLLKDSGVTVVQVGEGSDELYCGYQNYVNYLTTYNTYYKPTKFIPYPVKQAGLWVAKKLFPQKTYHLGILERWASKQNIFWGGAIAFPEPEKQMLFTDKLNFTYDSILEKIYPGFNQDYDSYAVVDYHLQQLQKHQPHADFLTKMTYLELKQRLPEILLTRLDKMTMATSVEGRVPFLDHDHVEFALQIPSKFKYKNGQTKYILKKACEGILPHDVIYRKKIGFAAPIVRWFTQGNYFPDYFSSLIKKKTGPLSYKTINTIFEKTRREIPGDSLYLWVLQNLLQHEVM